MPFSKNFPLKPILRESSLEYWYAENQKPRSRMNMSFGTDINDDKSNRSTRLVRFCRYVPCKVNLIEYNPIDDGEFQQASEAVDPCLCQSA
jgi:23S rRNA (adenine2503-C2)-methyltransferase